MTPLTALIPAQTLTREETAAQSLAGGTAGIALLHVERARAGTGDWATAHTYLRQATSAPVNASTAGTGLYYGAPALAFVLHAAADGHPAYRSATAALDPHVLRLVRRRLATAAARRRRREPATFSEYDVFSGLTGLGALLLACLPGSGELGDVLHYLVRRTEPHLDEGMWVPGWWVAHNPDPTMPTPGGHANTGMAHGAAVILGPGNDLWHVRRVGR